MPVRGAAGVGLETLTRRHAFKLCPTIDCSVEDCALAVGAIVGYDSIKSAARMNNGVVIFVDSFDKVATIVEQGVVIKETFVQAIPLVNPAKKIVLSQVPPFISNEMLERELVRHGQLMSPIRSFSLGCKSPKLRHVVSFRRQVFMILKNNSEGLNLVLKFRVEDYDYNVYVSSEKMKCFGCGMEGHLIRSCPEKITAETNNKNTELGESSKSQRQKQNELDESQRLEQGESNETQGQKLNTSQGQKQNEQNDLQGQKQNELDESRVLEQSESNETRAQKLFESDKSQGQKQNEQNDLQGQKRSELNESHEQIFFNESNESQGQKQNESELIKMKQVHKAQRLDLVVGEGSVENSQCDTDTEKEASVSTQKEVEEEECSLDGESEMIVDDNASKDNERKRKIRDGCQFSVKMKKLPLRDCSQTVDSDVEVDSDVDSLASLQSLSLPKSGYSMLSIKNFLKNTKGARNLKIESVFPDLQLFIDSVKNLQKCSGSEGEKGFTDQEIYRLKKFVLKAKRQLEDGEYD